MLDRRARQPAAVWHAKAGGDLLPLFGHCGEPAAGVCGLFAGQQGAASQLARRTTQVASQLATRWPASRLDMAALCWPGSRARASSRRSGSTAVAWKGKGTHRPPSVLSAGPARRARVTHWCSLQTHRMPSRRTLVSCRAECCWATSRAAAPLVRATCRGACGCSRLLQWRPRAPCKGIQPFPRASNAGLPTLLPRARLALPAV